MGAKHTCFLIPLCHNISLKCGLCHVHVFGKCSDALCSAPAPLSACTTLTLFDQRLGALLHSYVDVKLKLLEEEQAVGIRAEVRTVGPTGNHR